MKKIMIMMIMMFYLERNFNYEMVWMTIYLGGMHFIN